MIRAGVLLFLLAATSLGASGCLLVPVPAPVVAPPVVVAPRPVYPYPYRWGYYRGGYHRGYGRHWY
jgi:hypothetical protein